MLIYALLKWGHILLMAGTFGALLVIQLGLQDDTAQSYDKTKKATSLALMMLLLGFVLGLGLYVMRIKMLNAAETPMTPKANMLVGIKFLLLFMAGGFMGVSGGKLKKENFGAAGLFRMLTIISLAIAAFLGVLVPIQ